MGFPAHLIRPSSNEILCRRNHMSLKALKINGFTKSSFKKKKKKVKNLYQSLCFMKCVHAQTDSENMAILQCYDCLPVC